MSVDGETLSAITGMEEACATARARVEDLVAELDDLRRCLRSVIAQRNEAQARVVDAALIHAELVRERDEARAEVERLRAEADRWKRSCNVFRERDWPKAFQATVTSLEREVSDAYEQLAKLHKLSKPWEGGAYRRGAEAMREACARWMSEREGISQWVYDDALSALPIPEEPT